jgi:YD repeat-containing protein
MLEKDYRRDVNLNQDKANFVLDRSFIVSVERYEYVDFEAGNYKMLYYNNAGKVYKEEFYYFNEHDNLELLEGRMKMGSGYNKTAYTYDNLGQLIGKKVVSKLVNTTESEWRYEYDEFGNVFALHIYKNGTYTTEYQVVYDQKTMLLSAILTQDEETEFLTILKFSNYSFFDE